MGAVIRKLRHACDHGDFEEVKAILTEKPELINMGLDDNQWSALFIVSRKNHVRIVNYICSLPGVDVNFANAYGNTALHASSYCGHESVVNTLLSKPDIDVNAKNKDGDTALHLACEGGRYAIVQSLLDHPDIDISIQNKSRRVAENIIRSDANKEAILIAFENYKNRRLASVPSAPPATKENHQRQPGMNQPPSAPPTYQHQSSPYAPTATVSDPMVSGSKDDPAESNLFRILDEYDKNISQLHVENAILKDQILLLQQQKNLPENEGKPLSSTSSSSSSLTLQEHIEQEISLLTTIQQCDQLKLLFSNIQFKIDEKKEIIRLKELESRVKEDVALADNCIICFTERRGIVFIPCGHFCMCLTCSDNFEECPMCRVKIITKQKVFA